METLTQIKSVACRAGEPTVTDAKVAELHRQVPEWQIVQHGGINHLERVFKFGDFAQALAFKGGVDAQVRLDMAWDFFHGARLGSGPGIGG